MWNNIITDDGEVSNYIFRQSLRSAKISSPIQIQQSNELPFSSDSNIQNLFSQIENIEEIVSNLSNLPIGTFFQNGISIHRLSSKHDYYILKKLNHIFN